MSLAMDGALPERPDPDFSKPEQQSREELRRLAEALAEGNSKDAARSAILYDALLAVKDGDSIQTAIDTLNSVASDKRVSAPVRALLNLYAATVYSDVYNQRRWVFDRRELPLEPIPADYNLWSGEQFKKVITDYIDKALGESHELQRAPLAEYGRVCGMSDKKDLIFYPTLYDFAAYKSISLLKNMAPSYYLFSYGMLTPADVYLRDKFTYQAPILRRILELYKSLIELHRNDTAPLILADVNRIQFIAEHVSSESEPAKAYSLLTDLYTKWSNVPYAAEALVAAGRYISQESDPAEIERFKSMADRHMKAFPSYQSNGCLSNIVSELMLPRVFVRHANAVVPGDTVKISITNYNTPQFDLKIYKVPYAWDGNNSYRFKSGSTPQLVRTIPVKSTAKAPFKSESTESIVFDKPGCYIVVPRYPGNEADDRSHSYEYIHCSGLSIQSTAFNSERWALVVNPLTGEPISGAQVEHVATNRQPVANPVKTDSDGTAPLTGKGGRYYVKKGADTFASPIYSSWYPGYDKERNYRICALTDLAIYHPGDTVRWSVVTESYFRGDARVEADARLRAILHDANYERIDTADVTTDGWGRAQGEFTLPKNGLTGQYSIEFQFVGLAQNNRGAAGNVGFTVSDYKLPTFFVEVTDIVRDSPDKGGVTLKGKVMTYSGFPEASARIDLNLKASLRRWGIWRNGPAGGDSFYSASATADDKGCFTFELPAELLKASPVSDPIFTAAVTAMSATGESQSASSSFTQGKPYIISSALPQVTDISRPVNLAVSMTDLSGKNITSEVRYAVTDAAGREAASGVVSTADPMADLSSIPSGVYSLTFTPADTALAEKFTVDSRILYRPTDKKCPLPDATLWIPQNSYTLNGTRRASIPLGVTGSENYVHYAVYADSTMLRQGWVRYPAGMHRFEYDLPDGTDKVSITLSCSSRYRTAKEQVNVCTPEADKSIKLSIESFRDRLTPGDKESWTFRVTDAKGRGIQAPVALDMYAKSLDNLAYRTFSINPVFGQPMSYYMDMNQAGDAATWLMKSFKGEACTPIGVPEYFISMPPFNGVNRISNVVMHRQILYSSRAAGGNGVMNLAEAKFAKAEATVEESVSADMADAGETVNTAGQPDDSEPGSPQQNDADYRTPETPLAFFQPALTTGADGTLNFTFTVPNANTTWKLCAYTYSRDMTVDCLTLEAIASKAVMVQPNLPRFMRTGDKVCVQSSVMNNTDSAQTIVTTVEIFDPATGKVIQTAAFSDSVKPLMSTKISTWVEAPLDANMIGYRVKSTSGRFTDGEQAIIPVLPAKEPVVETTTFYIPADMDKFSIKLPKMPKDARVTLQFCENPTWYVVTALPGIRADKTNSALAASAAIFSAAVAEGILRTDPDIAKAIKTWISSDRGDSTLVSMLERNSDLKTVLLNSTPWVMDARSQTERMQRLALLFDPETIAGTYSDAVKTLSTLACPDGGWAWIGQYKESSMWVTENILAMMGRLRSLGYLPDNQELNRMIDNAVGYYDSQIEKAYRKDSSYTSPLAVLIRGYYPEKTLSATMKNFTANTLGVESRQWKNRDIPAKAIDAIILNNNSYPSVAKEIVASIRDFAVVKPERGMWWPSLDNMTVWSMGKISATSIVLDAFTQAAPGSPDIDLIRQWLILQKEAKDWGTSVSTSNAIASILLSGSKWTRPAQGASVSIGSRKVTVTETDSLLGAFRENVTDYRPSSAKLTVEKIAGTPSWGAVYTQYVGNMSDIEAASCPDLSIEKTLYRRVVADSGIKWEEPTDLKVGDVIQVNLTIVANRDMDYVAVVDSRGACLEPVEQLPAPIFSEGICFYRENRDSSTDMFITHLPKGTYRISYEMYVNNAGTFSAGVASIQSQYAPALSAHSAGNTLTVKE